jgi:hypothetical protein
MHADGASTHAAASRLRLLSTKNGAPAQPMSVAGGGPGGPKQTRRDGIMGGVYVKLLGRAFPRPSCKYSMHDLDGWIIFQLCM